ncbi:MAG: hypothetical protein ACXVAG_16285 [Vulcanimicrobiaceae bacterium]
MDALKRCATGVVKSVFDVSPFPAGFTAPTNTKALTQTRTRMNIRRPPHANAAQRSPLGHVPIALMTGPLDARAAALADKNCERFLVFRIVYSADAVTGSKQPIRRYL